MQPLLQLLDFPINRDILSNIGPVTWGVGSGSDFYGWIMASLTLVAAALCFGNIIFLHQYEFTRKHLEKTRRFRILEANREFAIFLYKPWQRIVGNFTLKVISVPLIYYFASSKGIWAVTCAFVIACIFFAKNCELILKLVLHSRSVFNRKHVLYRKSPDFFRKRLIFELFRRFLYFAVAFSLLSYCLHRLDPQMYAFQNRNVPLFLLHIHGTIAGMTSLGTSMLTSESISALAFDIVRMIFVIILIGIFVNVVFAGLVYENASIKPKQRMRRQSDSRFDVGDRPITRGDVLAMVQLCIQEITGVRPDGFQGNPNLAKDLQVDAVDLTRLQSTLEDYFEIGPVSVSEIKCCHTVEDWVSLFVEKVKNPSSSQQLTFNLQKTASRMK
ncbi:MAG: hypothetical protein H0X66_18740 [Verrucomicrobia bacterium]|nr:hypothetical protein [Verrucomicrobiota bacterium]